MKIQQSNKVKVEIIEIGMQVKPFKVIFIMKRLGSSHFVMPDIIHETKLLRTGDGYQVEGSYAMFGEVSGKATGMSTFFRTEFIRSAV